MIDKHTQTEAFRRWISEDLRPEPPKREPPKHKLSHIPFAIPKREEIVSAERIENA